MEREKEITIHYSLSFGELLSMQYHFSAIKPLYARIIFIISFFLVGPFIVCTALQGKCAVIPWPEFYTNLVMSLVNHKVLWCLLLLVFAFFGISLLLLPLSALLHYKKLAFLFKDVSITVTPDKIISKTRTTETVLKWAAVAKVVQNKSLIMIQISKFPPMVVAIPKRAFENNQEAEAFFNFVHENWKRAAK